MVNSSSIHFVRFCVLIFFSNKHYFIHVCTFSSKSAGYLLPSNNKYAALQNKVMNIKVLVQLRIKDSPLGTLVKEGCEKGVGVFLHLCWFFLLVLYTNFLLLKTENYFIHINFMQHWFLGKEGKKKKKDNYHKDILTDLILFKSRLNFCYS